MQGFQSSALTLLLSSTFIILKSLYVSLILSLSSAMVITHGDISHRGHGFNDISSKLAHCLVLFSVLCGFISFILCLAAEAAKSEVSWMIINRVSEDKSDMCTYSGSGRSALSCAIAAFLLLAVAMFTEHGYMLVALTSSPQRPQLAPVALVAPEGHHQPHRSSSRALTAQACALIIAIWICFTIAEVLLIIGMGIESSHLRNWMLPRPRCPAVRPGLFAAAGVFGLLTVFLGVGLYLSALLAQRLQQGEEQNMHPSLHQPHHGRTAPTAVPHGLHLMGSQPLPEGQQPHLKPSPSS